MNKTHLIICPFCKGSLEIESSSGKVVNKWEKSSPASAKEKFSEALKKIEEGKKNRENFFASAADKLKERKEKTEQIFGEELKKIKEEGLTEPPPRPFDFD